MRKIILASTSPRRKEILGKTGLPFETVASPFEEDMTLNLPPTDLAKTLSRGKAEAVAKNYDDALIIGGDTFIAYEGKMLGKPHTPERAKEMLKTLSGKQHSVFSGITLIDSKTGKIVSEAVETRVFFRKLTDKEIDYYVSTGEPLDRAGSYAINEIGGILVDRIEGDFYNVMGLPQVYYGVGVGETELELVRSELEQSQSIKLEAVDISKAFLELFAENLAKTKNFPQMKSFLKTVGSNRIIREGKVYITFQKPYDLLYKLPDLARVETSDKTANETANCKWWTKGLKLGTPFLT